MTEWLVQYLGLEVPEGANVHFEWGNLPRGESGLLLVIAVCSAVALTGWLYRREGRASVLRKGLLATLRVLAFAVLLGVYLEPRLAVDLERTVEGQTVVLWDTSLSMSLTDRYVDEGRRLRLAKAVGIANPDDLAALTRQEVAWRLIKRTGLLDGLAERNTLVVYAFDSKARRLDSGALMAEAQGAGALGLESDGVATDLAGAVRKALEEAGGRSVAGLVAITDGRINKGEGKQGVIAALDRRRIPFFAIGIGDPTPPVNLEVVEISADPRVLIGDPMAVDATVRARGFEGETVEVEFSIKPAGAQEGTVLERRAVHFEEDERPVPLRFIYKPELAGDYIFSLRISPREEEPVTEDNVKTAPVKVTDEKTRVLLVAGSPSFEYEFLKTRLVREKTAIVSCWLQSADTAFPQDGNVRIDDMPRSVEELREYDAVVFMDPSPETFDGPLVKALKSFVADTKGGLLFIPGAKYASALFQDLASKPLLDLLPVIPGDLLGSRVSATDRWPYKATPDGLDHPATRLASSPELCRLLWARLPGPFFCYPVLRQKAGAMVLVRHEDPGTIRESGAQPLLAAHFFAGGPVVWQGTDEIWRWRSVAPRLYDRYWVGMLRFLVQGRLAGGRKRVELLTDKEVYYLGEPIHVRAHAFDRSYRPLLVSELLAKASVADEQVEVRLEAAKGGGQAGWFEGSLIPPGQGQLELTLRLPDDDPGATPESLKVQIKRPDLEFSVPRLDEETLSSIAQATSGSLIAPEEIGGLPEQIPARTEQLIVAGTPIALWDRWQVVLFVCLLLTLEWSVRKRSRMI